jgi:predicted phage tail protein
VQVSVFQREIKALAAKMPFLKKIINRWHKRADSRNNFTMAKNVERKKEKDIF